MTASIHIALFSELRFTTAADADVTPRGRKARAMVAWLACCPGHSASRDRIVGIFWGDRGEEQARGSLRQALADLKLTAPEVAALVRSDRTSIGLEPEGWTSDLHQLETAIASRDASGLAEVIDRIRGELLADLAGLSPMFDDWRMAEQARLEQVLEGPVLALARDTTPTLPQVARTIFGGLQRLLTGNEEIVRLGMALDAEAGDIASIHRRYRTLESVLRREFDTTPSPVTKRLLATLAAAAYAGPEPADGGAATGGAAPVVVITPFAVLGSDDNAAALARVLGIDLETALARLPDLKVLRHSETGSVPREDLIRGAIAGYSLAGSVRAATVGGLRLSLSLADIGTGRTIWSHQETAAYDHLGDAIDRVVEQVASAVLPTVEHDLIHSRRLETAAPDAYALYLKARTTLLTTASLAEAQAAGQMLERALEIEPRFINARLNLVLCYNTDFLQRTAGHDPLPWRERAMRLAREAWTLEPDNPEVLARLGWCHLRQQMWEDSEAMLRQALAHGPLHTDNLEQIGFAMVLLGLVDEGMGLLRQAFRLNPFPRSDYFADIAIAMLLQGDAKGAAQQLDLAADRSILYQAVHAACLGLISEKEPAHRLLCRVRRELATIWQPDSPPADSDLVSTMLSFLPLRQPAHQALLLDGWRRAGLAA